MGILRKQKNGQAGDWIQPGQIIPSPSGGPDWLSGPGTQPVPVRLRPATSTGNSGWLRGALYLSPGSLVWRPESGASAEPVELATATMMPGQVLGKGRSARVADFVELETPAGRFHLDMDPVLFEMTLQLVAEAAAQEDLSDGP